MFSATYGFDKLASEGELFYSCKAIEKVSIELQSFAEGKYADPSFEVHTCKKFSLYLKYVCEELVSIFKDADFSEGPIKKTEWVDHFYKAVMEFYEKQESDGSLNINE